MNAANIVGYTGDAEVYCVECASITYTPGTKYLDRAVNNSLDMLTDARHIVVKDSEGNEVTPIFADSESDTQLYCSLCHELIESKWITWALPQSLCQSIGIEPTDTLPSCVWPGGYPLIYYHDTDAQYPTAHHTARRELECNPVCADCANSYDLRPGIHAADVYYEGPPMMCDHCGKDIDSAYGDPNEEEEITD